MAVCRNLEVKDKEGALRAVQDAFREGTIEHLDGVSVTYPDFWFNVRPSNTEPVLRVRLEAASRASAELAASRLRDLLASY